MLTLAPFYILVLKGNALLVDAMNQRYERLFAGRDVVGKSIDEVFFDTGLDELVGIIREVYRTGRAITTPRIRTRIALEPDKHSERSLNGTLSPKGTLYFVYAIVPTHEVSGNVDGVVVYAEDVSEEAAREAADRRDKLKLMVEHADQVALGLYDAHSGELLQASPRYLDVLQRAHGLPRGTIVGRKWDDLAFVPAGAPAGEIFESVRESGTSRRLREVRVRLADGAEMVWDCTLTSARYPM